MGSVQCVPALVTYTRIVVQSGMGSVQCVPALVMYPDCGPVWHGQCSVCASLSHVPGIRPCLAWAVFFFFFHLRAHNQHVDYSGAYNWECSLWLH